jgi:predicted regulator of Ras-like GTPase activity (Roadblock/LC7/MglB family)
MSTDMDAVIRQLVDYVVDGVPGVRGALIASADGFVLAARLPPESGIDSSAVAAMSAATLGLANRLVGLTGETPADFSMQRSAHSCVFVFAVGASAVLTVLADESADARRVERVGREVSSGIRHAFEPVPQSAPDGGLPPPVVP